MTMHRNRPSRTISRILIALLAFAVLLLGRPRTGNPTTTEPALSGDRS